MSSMCLSSCSHYYYAPNSNPTPLFANKHEVSLNINSSAGTWHGGGEIQAAYAVGNHLAIMGNSLWGSGESDSSNPKYQNDSGRGSYYEAAFGYFLATKGKVTRKGVFEIYGGAGQGSVVNNFSSSGFSKNSFSKLFVQPNFGFRSKVFDIAVSSRFSWVNIHVKENHADIINDEYAYKDLLFIEQHPGSFMWEPALTLQAGWQPIKFKLQLTGSNNLNYSEYAQDDIILALGINARFNLKKQKKLVN